MRKKKRKISRPKDYARTTSILVYPLSPPVPCAHPHMASEIVVTHTVDPSFENDIIPVVTDSWHVELMNTAIAEAKKCAFSDKHYSAGCVIAVDGKPLTTGFSREVGFDKHGAVDAACSKLSGEVPQYFFNYDMYCTIEPGGIRLNGRDTETEQIVDSKIRNVYLGTCEPGYFVREKGYEVLRKAGIGVFVVDETGVSQGNLRKACLAPNTHLLFDGTDTINRVLREM
jgi:pyrimidine deaminase RibD-like protein